MKVEFNSGLDDLGKGDVSRFQRLRPEKGSIAKNLNLG